MQNYGFSQRRNQLTNDFTRENMVQQQGMNIGRQRFSRNRDDMNRGFQEQFPRATGRLARLGSGVRSGVANQGLARFVGGFQRGMSDLDTQEAQAEANFQQEMAARAEAYQRMLLGLDEDMAEGRLGADPYAGVV